MFLLKTPLPFYRDGDKALSRMLHYWALTAALYLLAILILAFEARVGGTTREGAWWLCGAMALGMVASYTAIRAHGRLRLTIAQLAAGQGLQAIAFILSAYAILPSVRGATLSLLLVVLMFCAFALPRAWSRRISGLAILALATTMAALVAREPVRYPLEVEVVHFVLATTLIAVVLYLTDQFNSLRNRLKSQKAELEQQKCELSDALARIQLIATRDDLTLLPNRRRMTEVLAVEEKRHYDESAALCVALLDIDHFKQINDVYGHAAGDEVLRNFANRLQEELRAEDVLARWGGEEFLLMLPHTEPATALSILDRLEKRLMEKPLRTAKATLAVTFSAGLASVYPGDTMADAIQSADRAMYQAKAAGRNRTRVFDPRMEAAALAQDELKTALLQSIHTQALVLHYQPQVTGDGVVTGAEALIRWNHPGRGLIFPGDFIPAAEEGNFIVAIGQWVLATACLQLSNWATRPQTAHLRLSVNVSAKQLRHPDFVGDVLTLLAATRIDPSRLKMEITETVLVDDVEAAIGKMVALKAAGVSFSLDDFGTGYSSLAYLRRLPLDEVKIDRSFVSDARGAADDGVIARAIISLAADLGFSVIAEGVETARQRDFLLQHGCNSFQGYFFSRPLPIEGFERFLAEAATAGPLALDRGARPLAAAPPAPLAVKT